MTAGEGTEDIVDLTARANEARARFVGAVAALGDKRRHVVAILRELRRYAVPIAIGAGVLVAGLSVATVWIVRRIATR